MQTTDVLIAGGGVIGSAIAYFLAANPGFSGDVTVIEPDPTYETASTPRSLGGIRQQFSNSENIDIGLFAHHFISNIGDYLSLDGAVPDVGFVEAGYLFLASETGQAVLTENQRAQSAAGAAIELLDCDQLIHRFPWISADGVAAAAVSLSGEGWVDPFSLLQAFRKKAQSLGVRFIADRVTGLQRAGHQITGVSLGNGNSFAAGTVINAAGAWAGALAAQAGIILPVEPRRRMVYVFDCRQPLDPLPPLTIDPSGVYFRPEGKSYLTGFSPPENQDPPGGDLSVDHHWFEAVIWPVLAARVPAFEAIKPTTSWAGYYDYNRIDHNAILGRHPEVDNFIFANGFSGHGLQQSPAVGRAIAELIVHGAYQSLDLSRLDFARFADGRLVHEKNVV
jgi:sarcosine oxidase